MPNWRRLNAVGYRLYSRLRDRRADLDLDLSRVVRDGAPKRLVHLNWGRIGDTVLSTGALKHYRRAFPEHEIVCVGREEVRWLVTPHVDRFVPLAPEERDLGRAFTAALGEGALDSTDLLTADIHLFYGGLARLRALIEKLPATRKILYEGYAPRSAIAPVRAFPSGVEVVPSAVKPGDPHVLHDVAHFFRALVERAGGVASAARDLLEGDFAPVVPLPAAAPLLDRIGLAPRSYVACQIASNNPKKDWPLTSWRQLIGARPETRFVVLGATADRERAARLGTPNVVDLCGRTSLAESGALIAQASAFVGIDSGMAHVAVNVGVPTVVIAQNSTLGWFFPYPPELARPNLLTLHNPRSPECIGCFFACPREPLWEMVRRGARCLRELAWQEVDRAWAESAGAAALDRNRA